MAGGDEELPVEGEVRIQRGAVVVSHAGVVEDAEPRFPCRESMDGARGSPAGSWTGFPVAGGSMAWPWNSGLYRWRFLMVYSGGCWSGNPAHLNPLPIFREKCKSFLNLSELRERRFP